MRCITPFGLVYYDSWVDAGEEKAHRHEHTLDRFPGATFDDLTEALDDPDRITIDPDPKSRTARS